LLSQKRLAFSTPRTLKKLKKNEESRCFLSFLTFLRNDPTAARPTTRCSLSAGGWGAGSGEQRACSIPESANPKCPLQPLTPVNGQLSTPIKPPNCDFDNPKISEVFQIIKLEKPSAAPAKMAPLRAQNTLFRQEFRAQCQAFLPRPPIWSAATRRRFEAMEAGWSRLAPKVSMISRLQKVAEDGPAAMMGDDRSLRAAVIPRL
jgi:hypothetical protein